MSPLDQSRVRVNVGPSTQPGHWPGMSSHNSQPCGIADLLQRSQTIGLECHERGEPEKMAAFCRQRSQANGLECHSRAPSARTSRRPSTVARPTAWNVTGRLRCRVWRIPAFNEARPKGRECHAYAILSSALSRCLQRSQANGLESHQPGVFVDKFQCSLQRSQANGLESHKLAQVNHQYADILQRSQANGLESHPRPNRSCSSFLNLQRSQANGLESHLTWPRRYFAR